MKIAFLGSPQPAATILDRLVTDGHDIVQVVTRPDRRRGRGNTPTGTPVAQRAIELNIATSYRLDELRVDDCELVVVVAYGRIIPAALLERCAMVNVHFSLLPRWRGAAPVERAILAGDTETGVAVMGIEPSLDTGPVYAEERVVITDHTSSELMADLAERGASLLSQVLSAWPHVEARPQIGDPTYADKLTAEDFRIEPNMSVSAAARRVRLERTRIELGGKTARIVRARVADAPVAAGAVEYTSGLFLGLSDGALEIIEIQPAGSRVMTAAEWWRGVQRHDLMAWQSVNPT